MSSQVEAERQVAKTCLHPGWQNFGMDSFSAEHEAELRRQLFELDSAMDSARHDPDAAPSLGELAEQREQVKARIQALQPEDADLGYQRGDKKFSKAETEETFIPSIMDGGGTGAGLQVLRRSDVDRLQLGIVDALVARFEVL